MTLFKSNNLFYWGITLSSLDSFPLFRNVSMYAPFISIICFILYYIQNAPHEKIRFKTNKFVICLIILYAFLISFIKGTFEYNNYSGFYNFSIQLVIAILLYKSFNLYFQSLKKEKYIETFATIFVKCSFPILLIGCLEILIFPYKPLYSTFMSLFSWRHTIDRIQLISGEPSWASRFILTYICLLPLASINRRRKFILLFISLIILFFTGSSLGIICIMVYFAITYFKKRYLIYYLGTMFLIVLISPIVFNSLNGYTRSRLEVLFSLSSTDIETLAVNSGSGSIMARFGNPILAYYMGKDNLICGVGGGYFFVSQNSYMNSIFPNAKNISNIEETGTTAKNLFARIFAEMGILCFSTMCISIIWIYRNRIFNNYIRGVFFAMLLLTINFDSLLHIYPLLLFCFLLNCPTKIVRITSR